MPSLRASNGLDHNIHAAATGGQRADSIDRVHTIVDLDDFFGAEFPGSSNLFIALHDGDGIAADGLRDLQEHESDWTAADHRNVVPNLDTSLLQSAQHAGERLSHGSGFKAHSVWNGEHVQLDDALGDLDVFGVSTVIEQ